VLPVGSGKYRVPKSLILKALRMEDEPASSNPAA
jgi:hypothetical protein